MEEVPHKKSAKLLNMAREEFGQSWQPTDAERNMLAAVTTPGFAICGLGAGQTNELSSPEHAAQWPHQRSIDGNLIRWLCMDQRAQKLVDPEGIQVCGAKITGVLNLEFLVVPFQLHLKQCAIPDGVSLYALEIPALNLEGSWVGRVEAEGIRAKGGVFLGQGFHAEGGVSLHGGQIGVALDCTGASFSNSKGFAFEADEISVGGSLFLQNVHSHGQVRFPGAQISGYLICYGSQFVNPAQKGQSQSGIALLAEGITVKGRVFLQSRFEGEVQLLDARIGSTLECTGGEFINPEGRALSLHRASIAADVFLDGCRAEGAVGLVGTHIGGDLRCRKANFTKADLSLEKASVTSISDAGSQGPIQGHLHLDGFVYRIADPLGADGRLIWLDLQPKEPFSPQPYLQLAKVLGDAGDEGEKIKVLVAMKDKEWSLKRQGFVAPVGWLQKFTIGYGYRPLLAFWEVVGLSALGWIIYRRSYLAGEIVPTDKDAYEQFKESGQPPCHYRRFFPSIYSVENSLPLVKLGMEETWEPDPCHDVPREKLKPALDAPVRWPAWLRWVPRMLAFTGLHADDDPTTPRSRAGRWATSAKFLRWFLWIQILLGWLLATLFLAGVSGIIKKE